MKIGLTTRAVGKLCALALALLACAPRVPADEYTYTVARDARRFLFQGAESQSAVVAPGKKKQCPNGRIFVSDDREHPPFAPVALAPAGSVLHWRDLPGPKLIPSQGVSVFFPALRAAAGKGSLQKMPRARLWETGLADHQLVSLPDGDLLYMGLYKSKEPIDPKPGWFDRTFRNGFGPGARAILPVWRSADCGQTFQFMSEIDPSGAGHEECANPRDVTCDEHGKPTYDMGGPDGPNLVVDRDDGTAYAVFPCVGRTFDEDAECTLSLGGKIAKTYVFSLKPGEKKFTNSGSYSPNLWGPTAVPLSANEMAVGLSGIGSSLAGVMIGTRDDGAVMFSFPKKALAVEGVAWGWEQQLKADGTPDGWPWKIPKQTGLRDNVRAKIASNTVLARVPGKSETLLLAFPAMVEKTEGQPATKTNGFRVYYYRPKTEEFVATDPVVPTGPAEKSIIMHLTAIDPGDGGPILLYWYDLDGAAKRARIRGRFVYTDAEGAAAESPHESADFDIARAGGEAAPFDVNSSPAYPFGDYKTAGGFLSPDVKDSPFSTTFTYRYFPVWIQPNGTVNYTEVTATRTIFKPQFQKKLSQDPELFIVKECCGFIPLIERARSRGRAVSPERRLGREAAALAFMLLAADPKLGNPRLRVATKRALRLRPQRATLTTLDQAPAMQNIFKDHEQESGLARPHIFRTKHLPGS